MLYNFVICKTNVGFTYTLFLLQTIEKSNSQLKRYLTNFKAIDKIMVFQTEIFT